MTVKLALVAALTALFMSLGQLLFKLGAVDMNSNNLPGFVLQVFTSPAILAACLLYAITTVIWIWVLSHAPLSLAYPFTALSYIITPLLSYMIYSEKLNLQFILGSSLLMIGIIVCSLSQASELGS